MAAFPAAPVVETWTEKFTRKFKENPLVPIGAAATIATLVIASAKMRRGESQKMNHWLRARLVAQGFTILAICGGAYMMNKRKQEAVLAEKLKQEEDRREFEKRLRDAEEAHRIERQSGTDILNQFAESSSAMGPASSAPPPSYGITVKQSWLGWLGWNTGSRSQSHIASTNASESEKENAP